MVKRRLSEQQQRRIRKNRQQAPSRPDTGSSPESAHGNQGLVIARYGKNADVELPAVTEAGIPHVVRCHIRANLNAIVPRSLEDYSQADTVVTGDRVEVALPVSSSTGLSADPSTPGLITNIQQRDSLMLRPDNHGKVRPVAANIESICIVFAPVPEPHENLIDRYLVAAETQGIKPVLICNKTDLLSSQQLDTFKQRFGNYARLGYQQFFVAAHQSGSLQHLEQFLSSRTAIFVGQSGVGKSSLLSALIPGFSEQIGDLSTAKSGKTKGRHTTTTSRLYHLPKGGCVIDSPGIREFGLWHLTPEAISSGFIEIAKVAQSCKFRDCQHQAEPGCAVLKAVEEGRISKQRFESFRYTLSSLSA